MSEENAILAANQQSVNLFGNSGFLLILLLLILLACTNGQTQKYFFVIILAIIAFMGGINKL